MGRYNDENAKGNQISIFDSVSNFSLNCEFSDFRYKRLKGSLNLLGKEKIQELIS